MTNYFSSHHLSTDDTIIIIGSIVIVIISVFILVLRSLTNSRNHQSSLTSTPGGLYHFETIDTTIKNSSTGQYSYENTTNNFQTYFKSNPLIDNAIMFSNRFASLSFYTSPQQSFATANLKEKPIVSDSSITYSQIFPNIDLKYTVNSSRLLEEFIVSNAATALKIDQIIQNAQSTNITNYQESNGKIDFYNQYEKVFTIPRPLMYEAKNPNIISFGLKYEIKPSAESQYSINKVITAEGKKWLSDPHRNYPIIIDLVIDNADTVGNWVSSDTTYTPIAQETTIKQEGTGSVKVSVNGYAGSGADGACTVSSNTNINTGSCVGRGNGDAVNFSSTVSTAVGATSIIVSSTPTGLAVGDKIMIINLQGTSGNYSNVGKYEIKTVTGIATTTVAFVGQTLTNAYDGTTQSIMVQRVPQYTTVNVNSGKSFSPSVWNGTKGGVLAFMANGTVTISGTLSVDGLGYSGGTGGVDGGATSTGGQTFCGTGGGAGGTINTVGSAGACGGGGGGGYNQGSAYAGGSGSASLGGGGGGGGSVHYATNPLGGGGAGGGYGTFGYYGVGTNNGTSGGSNVSGAGATGGLAGGGAGGGGTYGTTVLDQLYLGSGGGGGGGGAATGGVGGNGGGIIYIGAYSIGITGTISSNGIGGGSSTYGGGGGGGAGGSIKIIADSATIGTNLISATAGAAGTSANASAGGAGGNGRTLISYQTNYSGSANSPTPVTTASIVNSSAYDTITKTTSVDLSNSIALTFYTYSNLAGQHLQFRFGETSPNENSYNITVGSTNTWEQKSWDISSISPTAMDAVTLFNFYISDGRQDQTFYFDNIQTVVNYAPNTLTLISPPNSSNTTVVPTFNTVTTDTESDNLQYKLQLCLDSAMSVGCSTFDQSSSNVGWSGQDVGTSAYASGTTAVYVIQSGSTLAVNTAYYWKTWAKDIGTSVNKNWSSTQASPYSFTTYPIPDTARNCLLNKSSDNSSIQITWTNPSTYKEGYLIQKNTDSGGYTTLTTIGSGFTGYTDSTTSSGHTYQYKITSYTGPVYGSSYCETPSLNLTSPYPTVPESGHIYIF
jgi:hypothetical protein